MARFRYSVIVLALFCTRAAPAWAFSGAEGASFLDIPVGAGPVSLGSAYTAWANDVYAPVWNPAGLGFIDSTEFGAMHQVYLEDTSYEFLSLVHPLGEKSGIGFSTQYFRPGDITATDTSGNNVGSFGGYYGAFSLSFGRRFTEKLAIGATGKMISAKIDDVSASAFGGDFGLFYRATPKLDLAGVVANVGSQIKFLDEGDPLPQAFRLGGVYRLPYQVSIALEGVKPHGATGHFHTGIEWPSSDETGFSLRTGYTTERNRGLDGMKGFSLGAAVPLWQHEFSYAWLPLGDLGRSHYFSLVFRFGDAARKRYLARKDVMSTDTDNLTDLLNEKENSLRKDRDLD